MRLTLLHFSLLQRRLLTASRHCKRLLVTSANTLTIALGHTYTHTPLSHPHARPYPRCQITILTHSHPIPSHVVSRLRSSDSLPQGRGCLPLVPLSPLPSVTTSPPTLFAHGGCREVPSFRGVTVMLPTGSPMYLLSPAHQVTSPPPTTGTDPLGFGSLSRLQTEVL